MGQQIPVSATNPNDPDAIMQSQVEYWKTHKATNADQARQKASAYQYATDHGISGAKWLDSDELKVAGATSSPDWSHLGTGLSVLGTGASLIANPALGAVAAVGTGAKIAGETAAEANAQQGAFGANSQTPASAYLTGGGDRSDPVLAGQSLDNPAMAPTAQQGLTAAANGGVGAGATPMAASTYNPYDPWSQLGPGPNGVPINPASSAPPAAQSGYIPIGPGYGFTPTTQFPSTGNPAQDAIVQQALQTQNNAGSWVAGQYIPAVKGQVDTNNQVGAGLGANLGAEQGYTKDFTTHNDALTQAGYEATAQANATDNQYNDAAQQGLSSDKTFNQGVYDTYAQGMGQFSQLQATPYQGDWVSDPTDVARQNQSYNDMEGIGGGSLDYTAQQAQLYQAALTLAASNGTDVNHEYQALQNLTGIGQGSLDVVNGANSPEAFAAQKSALTQLGNLTTPERTAQEEFLYEQQRLQEEQQQRSSRAAVMSNLRARGMSGSGLELTNQLGSDQITSENRLLGDLGTQATAVQRAMAALQNYGGLSTDMVSQGNQIAQGNQQTRLGGSTAQAQLASNIRGQSDNMSMFNAGQSNQVAVANAGFANSNSQFNAHESNVASANNQSTRLAGYQGAAQEANAMRTADDTVGLANKDQQGISNRFQDTYRADQQVDAENRLTDVQQAGVTKSSQDVRDIDDATRIGQGTAQTTLGNTNNALDRDTTNGINNKTANDKLTSDTNGYWTTMGSLGQQNVNNIGAVAPMITNAGTSAQGALTSAVGTGIANNPGAGATTPVGAPIYVQPKKVAF